MRISVSLVVFLAVAFFAGCEPIEQLRDQFKTLTPYEQYAESLRAAGLDNSVVGIRWLNAGSLDSLSRAHVGLPYREIAFFNPTTPTSTVYAFELSRGHRLTVAVDYTSTDSSRLFVDLFETPREGLDAPVHRASADSSGRMSYRVRRSRLYLLRIQPEILAGGRYEVAIEAGPSLRFPVEGKSSGAIRSFFGDSRDGGRRDHHGVDIFATRGTPVLAGTDGSISRVQETDLGGKVVWLRAREDNYNLYYAHLDSQLVSARENVRSGDTLGLIGNTGNARYTPPHLHFGIYQRGPVDPWPFIHQSLETPPSIPSDVEAFGIWSRILGSSEPLRQSANVRSVTLQTLPQQQAILVEGAVGNWYRVRLPDGATGYVRSGAVATATVAVNSFVSASGLVLKSHPLPGSTPVDTLLPGSMVNVYAREKNYALLNNPDDTWAWMEIQTTDGD